VGVRTGRVERAGRSLPLEVWYPATDEYGGQDLGEETGDRFEILPGLPSVRQDAVRDAAPRPGRRPLVASSHGYGGHRRQSTFLCTHLASHGYVVAAVDHVGNTIFDAMRAALAMQAGEPRTDPDAILREFIPLRPPDVSAAIDVVLGGVAGLEDVADPERIGMAGHSFGGWTTLAVTARDRRIRAAFPLAPAGGSSPLPVDPLRDSIDFRWDREVPTLFVVAARDTLLPLAGMHELFGRTPPAKRMVVIENADHMHFCDRIEEVHELFRLMPQDPVFRDIQQAIPPITELCPGEHGYVTVRGLGLAHMDAHLRGDERAAHFLAGDVRATLAARGVSVAVVPG